MILYKTYKNLLIFCWIFHSGNFDDDTLITYDTETEVYSSCSANLNDENYVIGGSNENQVTTGKVI